MSNFVLRRVRALDWWIISAMVLLLAASVLMLWSTSSGGDPTAVGTLAYQRFLRQSLYSVVAVGVSMAVAIGLDLRALERLAIPLFVCGCLLLLAVGLFGTVVNGTRGWFVMGAISFQPVELSKILFIIFFARVLKRWSRHLQEVRSVVLTAVGTLVTTALLLVQPDFGSAMVFVVLWAGMILMIGLKRSHLLTFLVAAALSAVIAWHFFAPYQQNRIRSFLDPSRDPRGSGYNVQQARIAVGNGGLFGRGLGFGPQSQLHFLPERQTDFIFSVIGEELGFVGASFIIICWGIILWRLLYWAEVVRDDFMLFVLLGSVVLLGFEVAATIGMNIGLLPIVGLPLPFVSYGGSSLLLTAVLIGINQNIIIESHRSHWLE